MRINFHSILDATPQSSNLEFSHITRRVFYQPRAWATPHTATGNSIRRNSLHSAVISTFKRRAQKGGTSAPHCALQLHAITSLVLFNYLANRHQTGRKGVESTQRLCAYLCTKSKRKKRQTPPEQEKTPLCQWFLGCKPKSGCFFTLFTAGAIHFFCLCR